MKFSKLFLLPTLLYAPFCLSNDFINQIIFNESDSHKDLNHEIYVQHQTFRAGGYHSLSNEFSTNLKAKWGAIAFSQKLKSNAYTTEDLSVLHTQNQQSAGLVFKHDLAEVFLGTHKQSLSFMVNDAYSFYLSKSSIETDIHFNFSGYIVNESLEDEQNAMRFGYLINDSTDLTLDCLSTDQLFGCDDIRLIVHSNDHKYWLGYKIVDSKLAATNLESDDFQINYEINTQYSTNHLAYQYKHLKVGANISEGSVTPFADLLYINSTINALGLGRKIIYTGFDYTSTHVFVANSWQLNRHNFMAQFDYNHTRVTDLSYKEFDSLLFLGIPILKKSVKYKPWDADFARAQLQYTYAFEDHTLIIDAKQLLYWNNQDQSKSVLVDSEEEQVQETEALIEDRFRWWDGLNITFGLQWKL